jgi:hypothetical protein
MDNKIKRVTTKKMFWNSFGIPATEICKGDMERDLT